MLQVHRAYKFYKDFILNYSLEKAVVYQQYGFTLQGSVVSKDWEVFAAILLDDRAKSGYGADLLHYEVKSAMTGTSFEYQYHRKHGLEKLNDDRTVDHIFVSRNRSYTDIEVWLVQRAQMLPVFERWFPELQENYLNKQRQRFRRSVTFGFVRANGQRLLEIIDGQLINHQ